jgi:hypothetical protein
MYNPDYTGKGSIRVVEYYEGGISGIVEYLYRLDSRLSRLIAIRQAFFCVAVALNHGYTVTVEETDPSLTWTSADGKTFNEGNK